MIYYYSRSYVEYSNGTKLSYYLVAELNRLGYHAKNLCHEKHNLSIKIPEEYQHNTIDIANKQFAISDDDFVIYPEEICDNPLHAKKCIRYLLNTPFAITGKPINYGPTDYLLSYSKLINDRLPQLYIIDDERKIFTKLKKTQKEDLVVFYFGKTEMNKLNDEVKNILRYKHFLPTKKTIITRFYPNNHTKTMEILAKAKLLISFDPMTNLNYEATLLNTPVILVSNPYHLKPLQFNVPLVDLYFSFEEYQQNWKEKDKQSAFELYCKHLETQSQEIKDAFTLINEHFNRIFLDSAYEEQTKTRNKQQIELDIQKQKMLNDIKVESIFFLQQAPYKIKKLCGRTSVLDFFYPRHMKSILKKIGLFEFCKNLYLKFKKK